MENQNVLINESSQASNQNTPKRRIRKLNRDTWVDYVIIALLSIFALVCFYPIWYTLIGSFNNGTDYMKGGVVLYPRIFTLANYQAVLSDNRIWQATFVTVLRCMTGPFLLVFFTAMVAYGMSRKKDMYGYNFFNTFMMITMFVSGGTIPYYILCKTLGFLNTFWIYIIPGMFNVYDMILIRTFLRGSPEELHEAAIIDGAGEFRIFVSIMIPCAMPILTTILTWGLIGHWNDYLTSEIYVPLKQNLHVLQYVLKKIINESGSAMATDLPTVIKKEVSSETVSLAAMLIGCIPMFIAFPFLQKYFTKGIYVGSLKG